MGRFEFSLKALQEARDKAVIDKPCPICDYDDAIRILEAAQAFTETDRRWLVDTIDEGISVGAMRNRFCDFVHALPDSGIGRREVINVCNGIQERAGRGRAQVNEKDAIPDAETEVKK
jgi:hypothetical protein